MPSGSHAWIAGLASWRECQGLEGGARNADDPLLRAWFAFLRRDDAP